MNEINLARLIDQPDLFEYSIEPEFSIEIANRIFYYGLML
jgi:hypothetical protein